MEVFLMLLSHISFSLGLIALVAGVCLYLWSVRAEPGAGIGLAKIVGVVVIVLAILELLCTIWSGFRVKHFDREMRELHSPVTIPANSPQQEPASPATSVNPAPANSAVTSPDNDNSSSSSAPVTPQSSE
jgi:hypothetical protein